MSGHACVLNQSLDIFLIITLTATGASLPCNGCSCVHSRPNQVARLKLAWLVTHIDPNSCSGKCHWVGLSFLFIYLNFFIFWGDESILCLIFCHFPTRRTFVSEASTYHSICGIYVFVPALVICQYSEPLEWTHRCNLPCVFELDGKLDQDSPAHPSLESLFVFQTLQIG